MRATGGLRDELSNDVVALVGGHIAGPRGTIPTAELVQRVLMLRVASSTSVDGKGKAVCST